MAIPTLLANFDNSLAARDRTSVITMTASGPVRYTAGANAAYIAEEGTTNFVQNPRFVDGLSYATNWFARDFTHSADRPAELPTDTKSILCTNNTGSTNNVGASVPGSASTRRIPSSPGSPAPTRCWAISRRRPWSTASLADAGRPGHGRETRTCMWPSTRPARWCAACGCTSATWCS